MRRRDYEILMELFSKALVNYDHSFMVAANGKRAIEQAIAYLLELSQKGKIVEEVEN